MRAWSRLNLHDPATQGLSKLRRKRWTPIWPHRRAGAETSLVGTASPEVARARLIQDRTPPRNADSRIRPSRFDCCAFLLASRASSTFATVSTQKGHLPKTLLT